MNSALGPNPSQNLPKLISLVPSWTETFLDLGFEVVGRTRHCIHPRAQVESVNVLGGTKDIDIDLLYELDFDWVVMDQEENPIDFFNSIRAPILASRVLDVESSLSFLANFARSAGRAGRAEVLSPEPKIAEPIVKLHSFIEKFRKLSVHLVENKEERRSQGLQYLDLPISDWVGALPFDSLLGERCPIEKVVYLIWRNPWMAAGKQTYIADGLKHIGFLDSELIDSPVRYPVVDLDNFDPHKTLFLFSTEPFPFGKKITDLKRLELPYGCVVDGEALSWFGVRSFQFLNSIA